MAARRKSAPEPAVPEQQAPERTTEPVRKVRIRDEEPVRAAGHILTEKGWVLER